jgi:hypothetical protein
LCESRAIEGYAVRTLVAIVVLMLASIAALAQEKLADIAGQWEVTAVELRPAAIQALTVDDPIYMGAVLEIGAARLAFVAKKGGELDDACVRPSWDGALIRCATGKFGPPGSALSDLGDRLRLEWYDNAILMLRRMR